MYKREDPDSDELGESPLTGDEIDEEGLEKTLAYHDNKYTKKRKLGAIVANLNKKNIIHPDSLV